MGEKHKPGEIAKESGQYPIEGPRRGKTGEERTVVKGEPFPPFPSEPAGIVLGQRLAPLPQ